MCKAADKQGKTNDGVPSDQQVPDEERVREQYAHEERVREQQAREPEFVAPASSSRGKGLSFKVLQWLTDTADDENEGEDAESRSKISAPVFGTFCILLHKIYSLFTAGW